MPFIINASSENPEGYIQRGASSEVLGDLDGDEFPELLLTNTVVPSVDVSVFYISSLSSSSFYRPLDGYTLKFSVYLATFLQILNS